MEPGKGSSNSIFNMAGKKPQSQQAGNGPGTPPLSGSTVASPHPRTYGDFLSHTNGDWNAEEDDDDDETFGYDNEDEDEFGLPSIVSMRRNGKRLASGKGKGPGGGSDTYHNGSDGSGSNPGPNRRRANSSDIAEERGPPSYPTTRKSEGKILRPQYKEILRDPANSLHLINHPPTPANATSKELDAHSTRISRINKFKRILQSSSISLSDLRDSSWSGIPEELRAMTWQLLLGYLPTSSERRVTTLERKRKEYLDGVRQAFDRGTSGTQGLVAAGVNSSSSVIPANTGRGRGLDESIWHQISIDVPRTNPHLELYSYEATQRSLERILYVWAIRHPASGYVQDPNIESGMDPGQLPKAVLDAVEADSFWCLTKLLDGIQDNYIFAQPGIQRQVSALRDLTMRIDAGLAKHLEKEGVEFIQFSFRWMNCLLMRELSLKNTIRMWDTYMAEEQGFSDFHLYVCAAFLVKWSDKLVKMDFQEVMMFLQALPTRNWTEKDIELLLSEAFIWQSLFRGSSAHLRNSSTAARPPLREATLIIPSTGERVRRSVTLRGAPGSSGLNTAGTVDDRTPLLQRSDTGLSQQGTLGTITANAKDGLRSAYQFASSRTGQGIVKCSLAFFLGSMATFVAPVAAFLGKQDGKHIVATVTVYFNPARSQGSMHEATLLATLAFVYAAFISFTSMGVSVLFGTWNMTALGNFGVPSRMRVTFLTATGHTIVLFIFLGGGLGFVGWLKQRLENPLVNVACSLTSLAIISILTKEEAVRIGTFSYEKVFQVLKMVIMGIVITTVVCLVVQPVSARKELRETMIKVTGSFGDMLAMITRGFLNGSEEELHNSSFIAASDRYKSVFTSLTKNLKEAKYEHYVFGTESEYHIEARLVDCMQRLAQNIGGLRSSAETQFDLLSQKSTGDSGILFSPLTSLTTPQTPYPSMFSPGIVSPLERQGRLRSIPTTPEESGKREGDLPKKNDDQECSLPTISSPIEIFERFITHLGPSMKSLAYTLKQILDELPCSPRAEYRIAVNTQFRSSLIDAIELYSNARRKALRSLYQRDELNQERPLNVVADFEEVAASCGYFSYSLLDFAEEMKVFLDILDELKRVDEEGYHRSWKWLMFWRHIQVRGRKEISGDGGKRYTLA
ncbi:hypothetical protein GP486_001136 [Trichoglossum hirsutum]|uniref:Rab-GAP TBC domain-containing protein n=1 Tax=Trichoglossum hirsutum TaxID=265104 RepID=A0A9P8LH91_9PEZI|nr:hypothetical protein GP486_001136 [Trichoglossum hirsutum]